MKNRRFSFMSLLAICCILLAATACSETKKETTKFRVLSYNVRHFMNGDKQVEYEAIAKIIKQLDADVVCFQEIDSVATRSNGENQMKEIAKLTQMHQSFSASIDLQGGKYGNGFLSKDKPTNTYKVPLPGVEPRSVLIAEFPTYVVMTTHIDFNHEVGMANRVESIQILTQLANKYKDKTVFLAGDLNDDDLDGDFFVEVKKNWNINSVYKNTFPTGTAKKCIDFILTFKGGVNLELLESDVIYQLEGVNVAHASDHYPIYCDFKNLKK